MKKQGLHHSENGSAIVWILVAIALLAALSFAFTKNSRTGLGNVDREQNRLQASEILDYSRHLKEAVRKVKIGGCTETEINFANNFNGSYVNGAAPSDQSCDIFDGRGAGMTWNRLSEAGGQWGITGAEIIPEIGTAAPDMVFKIQNLNADLCLQINALLGYAPAVNPPATNAATCDIINGACQFTGTYAGTFTVTNAGGDFDSLQAGCYNDNNTDNYIFYQVLLAR